EIPAELSVLAVHVVGTEADRARLRELAREHRARPRRRIRAPLDRLDRPKIGEPERAQLDRRHATLLAASGSRRYSGSIASTGPKSCASRAWNRALGTCRSSPS